MLSRKGLGPGVWLLFPLLTGLAYFSSISGVGVKANSLKLQSEGSTEYVVYTDKEEDINLQLIYQATTENKSPQSIEAYYTYGRDMISFDGTEAIPVKLLEQGSARLGIKYQLRLTGMEGKQETGINTLGSLSMNLSDKEPYFKIMNDKGSWGIGTADVSLTGKIQKLLPESLDGFLVRNSFMLNKGIYEGLVTIYKTEDMAEAEKSIPLKSLGLTEKIISEIQQSGQEYSMLELLASYNFTLPLINLEGQDSPYPLKGQITFRKYILIDNKK